MRNMHAPKVKPLILLGRQTRHPHTNHRAGSTLLVSAAADFLSFAVRPEGAFHQWREVPPRELSIALVADERFGRATGWIEAS
jgi:hypothetical protein